MDSLLSMCQAEIAEGSLIQVQCGIKKVFFILEWAYCMLYYIFTLFQSRLHKGVNRLNEPNVIGDAYRYISTMLYPINIFRYNHIS